MGRRLIPTSVGGRVAVGAALILLASLHAPWYVAHGAGGAAITLSALDAFASVDVALGLAALCSLGLAVGSRSRAAGIARGLTGAGATALIARRMASLPSVPVHPYSLLYVHAGGLRWGAVLGLAAAVTITGAAVADVVRGPRKRPALLSPEAGIAARDAWSATWVSRVVVLIAGVIGALRFEPAGVSTSPLQHPFGHLGNVLLAPSVSWDARPYMEIAQAGYYDVSHTAYFPLYPLAVRAGNWLIGSYAVAGVLISVLALTIALTLLHRLVTLDVGEQFARAAVMATALFPMSLFFSAVYTESLFLALSLGCFYAARRQRWAWAGVLGALASATRNTGVLLLVPVLILYLYGPSPATRRLRDAARGARHGIARLRPRYPLRADVLWALLIPLGLVAFLVYLSSRHGLGAAAPFDSEKNDAMRHVRPLAGLWDGARDAFRALRQLNAGPGHRYLDTWNGSPRDFAAEMALVEFSFVAFALAALAGVLRRLPFAYGAYAAAAVLVAVSTPASYDAVVSVPRYVAVIFPLTAWLGIVACERRRLDTVLIVSSALLAVFAMQFGGFRFVA